MSDALVLAAAAAAPILLAAGAGAYLRREPGGPGALLAGNLLVLALLLALAFLGFELHYRFFYDATDSWGVTRTDQRWYERHVRRNNMGLRDDVDYEADLHPGRRRLSFLGDSFTMAAGVRRVEDRFASRVAGSLAGDWETHVLALGGMDTQHEIVTLTRALDQGYRVERVVLVYCLNDIADLVPAWQQVRRRVYGHVDALPFLLRHSFALNTLHFRLLARREPELLRYFEFLRDAYAGEPWRRQQRRLALLEEVVEAGGGELMAVIFPFVHELGGEYSHADAHAVLGAFWYERGIPWLDLLPAFRAHAGEELVVNRWDAHPNERAHAIAAEAIAPFLAAHDAPVRTEGRAGSVGEALRARGRAESAAAIYALVLEAEPDDPRARREHALALAALGQAPRP